MARFSEKALLRHEFLSEQEKDNLITTTEKNICEFKSKYLWCTYLPYLLRKKSNEKLHLDYVILFKVAPINFEADGFTIKSFSKELLEKTYLDEVFSVTDLEESDWVTDSEDSD